MRNVLLIATGLAGVLAIGIGVWALDSNSSAPSSPKPREPVTAATIDISLRAGTKRGRRYAVHVDCGSGDRRPGAVLDKPYTPAPLCRTIAADPRAYTASFVNAECVGGLTILDLSIAGRIDGHHVAIRQQGMCGPQSIHRWWHLLYRYRTSLDLPGWVGRGLA